MVRRFHRGIGTIGLLFVCLACGGLDTEGLSTQADVWVTLAKDQLTTVIAPAAPDAAPVDEEPGLGEEPGVGEVVDSPPPSPVPTAVPAPPVQGAPGGLASALGVPAQGGELLSDETKHTQILHRDAWDAATIWQSYDVAIGAAGWERMASPVPPFEGIYRRGASFLDVRVAARGPSVMVEIDKKP